MYFENWNDLFFKIIKLRTLPKKIPLRQKILKIRSYSFFSFFYNPFFSFFVIIRIRFFALKFFFFSFFSSFLNLDHNILRFRYFLFFTASWGFLFFYPGIPDMPTDLVDEEQVLG
ncbi:MAG: hypothetical protein B7Y25_04050 [Alphaproteobacteria bacterium 16-39-46]|nr:MAG: hypothetical protein B7Y25_04050 [Alphaproteobacteria bacterium 16-39-46]OZA43873.1 MAG: hypothetical protein B7X84_02075 [Alphaproteobacteria bacterium 17-39-52]